MDKKSVSRLRELHPEWVEAFDLHNSNHKIVSASSFSLDKELQDEFLRTIDVVIYSQMIEFEILREKTDKQPDKKKKSKIYDQMIKVLKILHPVETRLLELYPELEKTFTLLKTIYPKETNG